MVPEVPKFVFSIFRIFFLRKKFFLIFWPLLGHFLVQQKFLITPFLAPGQFTTENKAIFGPNQQFFWGKNLTGRGSNIIKIFSESVLWVLKTIWFFDPPPSPGGSDTRSHPLATCWIFQNVASFTKAMINHPSYRIISKEWEQCFFKRIPTWLLISDKLLKQSPLQQQK